MLDLTTEHRLASFAGFKMPASDEAEKGVLSCLVQEPSRLANGLNSMSQSLFYHPANQELFGVLVDELVCGKPLDIVNLTHRLREQGKLDKIGGPSFLAEIYSFVPLTTHFSFYLDTLKTLHTQRQQIDAHARCLTIMLQATENEVAEAVESTVGILEEATRSPGQLLKSHSAATALDSLFAEIEHRAKNPGRLPGISTGFSTMDKRTGGMMPGQVWVFAGEPGDGKSTIMQNLAEAAAGNGHKVRWYPLEMPHNEQLLRLLASSSQVNNENLYRGTLTNGEQQAVANAVYRLKQQNIEIVDVEDATATDIFADIERSDAEVIVVDYLQLMEDSSQRKSDTREGVLSSISRRQKRLARRTGKVILTASQLNDNGRLRESRAIGQDADKVFLVKKFEAKTETGFDDTMRKLWCDKNRGGRRHWQIDLKFIGQVFQFREVPADSEESP